ncbi:MAG TPA: hypothetical protein DEQ98_13970 [Acidobacteria bacterium]|jgi:hypothetical protein|nr:hypothetical protein [Acidobacteriota bacterium]HCE04337.1 hypothetical protein [Acidobacteriota bacterium]|tara:strand:+ start:1165 stop:1608 length:444 start_codon:yes stop_codon:yes gene_type:complete
MKLDTTNWSGEGTFTQTLIDALDAVEQVALLRVEDASSSRSDVEFNFISNELFLRFGTRDRQVRAKMLGIVPVTRTVTEPVMTVSELERALCEIDGVGPPDYADAGMLQYLRTERIVPPYQTRGYKLVELVRIYEVGSESRQAPDDV